MPTVTTLADEPTALLIDKLGLTISGLTILRDVSLSVRAGEFVGLIGPNGAGKTSLVNAISGTVGITTGHIGFGSVDVTEWPTDKRARHGLGRTFQTSNLFPALTVHENVRLGAQAKSQSWRDMLRPPRANRETLNRARDCIDRVGLGALSATQAGALSHGDKRRLELAILLASESTIVLLDEPMAGVNVDDLDELVGLVARLHAESNLTTILIEHHIGVVTSLADRIAVLHHGSLLAFDTPAAVMANELVQSAYVGDAL